MNDMKNGSLTASNACLHPFGGKNLPQILAEHLTPEMTSNFRKPLQHPG